MTTRLPEPVTRWEEARRLLLFIEYEGPWERLEQFFYGIRRDNTLRWEIPRDPRGWRALLGWLGDLCDRRNIAWTRRHAARGTRPRDHWKRRALP